MISIPRLRSIGIDGFGMFPGPGGEGGLHADLLPGLTLIIGANGLGKTTFITLLYRMLSGPADIPALAAGEELGTRRLEATTLPPGLRGIFAARVADRAQSAVATLGLTFAEQQVTISRRLSNLSLVALEVDGTPSDELTEDVFRTKIADLAGVGSFGDFLLMLRYLVFYFEDRRALVWDKSAQRQLLRMLFLPPVVAQQWTIMERSILSQDSDVRNFQSVFGRQERQLATNVSKLKSATTLRAELQTLEELQKNDNARLLELAPLTIELDLMRKAAISDHLDAQQNREARFRAVEEAKLLAIRARFPEQAATSRYILAHLMSECECLVCGTHVPEAAEDYEARIEADQCVICATPLSKVVGIVEARQVADGRVAKRITALVEADKRLAGTARHRVQAENEFNQHRRLLATLEAAVAERTARINEIVDLLPPSELALREQRDELHRLRSSLEARKAQLAEERRQFALFVAERTEELLQQSDEIARLFDQYASGFLSETVALTWSTTRARVGQTGEAIEFPSFDLDMSGSDFGSVVRRAGPADVSESQREFIDLAFRMALMRAASASGAGSLVIDTPESSLDAVFAKRAAQILLRFANEPDNGLLITSNLIEGSLIPTLAQGISETPEPRRRLIDLFAVARSTAAVEAEREAYAEVRHRLLGEALA
jgi:hypothetical protein